MVMPLVSLSWHRLVVSLLVITLGLYSAQTLKQVDQDFRVLYAEYTLAATDLAHVLADVMRYRATIVKAMRAPTRKEFEDIAASLPDQFAQIVIVVERFNDTGTRVSYRGFSRNQDIQSVQKSLDEYFTADDRTVSLLRSAWVAQSQQEAVELRNQAERQAAVTAGDKLVQAILALDRLQETVVEVGKELKTEETRVVRDISATLLLGSVLIGILNLYLLRRTPVSASGST